MSERPKCEDVQTFLTWIHDPGSVFEIRIPNCPQHKGANWQKTTAGWFDDTTKAAAEIERVEQSEPAGIYVTVNPVDPSLLALASNRIQYGQKKATGDSDIQKRRWLFIDIDPKRKSGISSTNNELAASSELAAEVKDWLGSFGLSQPIEGMSGNGHYLLYRIDLPNDTASTELVERFLTVLDQRFSNDEAEIDTTGKNAARVIKVLGTMARKGDDYTPAGRPKSEHRPHRRSWFHVPATMPGIIRAEQLEAIAGSAKPKGNLAETGFTPSLGDFDLQSWLDQNHVPVGERSPWRNGHRWVFTEAPPLCDHESDGSGFITQHGDGNIGAGCHHNHCTWGWKDLRQYYEPGCYDRPQEQQVESKQADAAPAVNVVNSSPGVHKSPVTHAVDILERYATKVATGDVPQLIPQRPAFEGIEVGPELVTLIGAPPGTGKTACASQIAFDGTELDPNLRVYVANAEMSFESLIRRQLTRITRVKSRAIRFGQLDDQQREKVRVAVAELREKLDRFFVLENPCLTSLVDLLDQPPGLIIVDYLQKFAPADREPRIGVNMVITTLRELANRGHAVLALSATKRGVNGRHDAKELSLASFKESGEAEFQADSAYVLRDEGPIDEGCDYIRLMTLSHLKNRHDAKVDHPVEFHMPRMEFNKREPETFAEFDSFAGDSLNPFGGSN